MADPEPTRRFRFTLKQLFLAVALVGVGLAIWNWVFRKEVVVRAPRAEEVVTHRTFGFLDAEWIARNVAVASGSFPSDTRLVACLHLVQAGQVADAAESSVGRPSYTWGEPIWLALNISVGLCEKDEVGGRVTCSGTGDTGPVGGRFNHNIKIVAKKTLPAKITPGRPHIVYVEGDQAIVVDGKMTVEEFAKANPGNYLVVTVEVR